LEAAGLKVSQVKTENEPGTPADEAIGTDPEAGSTAKVGDTVVLIIASGQVEVPDLLGMTQEEAEALLDELDLVYSVSPEETDEFKPGEISYQSRVGLVPYDVRIERRVAQEPVPTTAVIPEDIIDKPFEEARDILENLDLRVRTREEESDKPVGTVLYSEPGVGTEVPLKS